MRSREVPQRETYMRCTQTEQDRLDRTSWVVGCIYAPGGRLRAGAARYCSPGGGKGGNLYEGDAEKRKALRRTKERHIAGRGGSIAV